MLFKICMLSKASTYYNKNICYYVIFHIKVMSVYMKSKIIFQFLLQQKINSVMIFFTKK